ncbi:uncharacterized protein LOC100178692 [Ciona intestinalis]
MSGISVVINSSGRRNVISNPPPPMERGVQSFSEFSSNLPFSVWTPNHVMRPQFYKHPNNAAPMLPPHHPYYDDHSRQMVASNLIVLTSEKVQKNSRLMTSPMTSSSDGVHSHVRRKSKEDCLSKPTKKRKFECGRCYDSSTRLSPCDACSSHRSRAKRHASSRSHGDDKSKSLKDKRAKHRRESKEVKDSHRESGELTSSSLEEQNIKQFLPPSKRRKVRTHVSKTAHQHSKIHPSPLHKAPVDLYNFSPTRRHGNRTSPSPRKQRSEDRSVSRSEECLGRKWRRNSSQESREMSSADDVLRSVSSSSPKKKVSSSREKEKHRNKKHSPTKRRSHRTRRRSSHKREHDRRRKESKDTDHNSKHKKQDKEKEIVENSIDRKGTGNVSKEVVSSSMVVFIGLNDTVYNMLVEILYTVYLKVLPDSTTVGFERSSPSNNKHDEVTKPEVTQTQCNQTNSEANEISSPTKVLSMSSKDNSITSSTDQTTVVSNSSIDPNTTNSEDKVPSQNTELYVKILKILENEEKLGKLIQDSGLLIKNQEVSAKKPTSPSGPVFHVNFDVEHPELDKQIDDGVDIDGLADIKNGTSCAIMGLKQSNSLQISEQAATNQSNIEDVSGSIDAATIDIKSSLQNVKEVSIEGNETLDDRLDNSVKDDMISVVPGASFMESTSDVDVKSPGSSVSTPTLELDESTDLIIHTMIDDDLKKKDNVEESPRVMNTDVESNKDVGNIANKQSFVKLQFPAAKITLNEKDVKPRMIDSCCGACRLLNRPLVDPRVGSHSKMYADNLLKRCLVCFKPVDPGMISTSCYKDLKVEFYMDKNEVGVSIPCWRYTYTDDVQHEPRVDETNQSNLDLHLPHTPNNVPDESLVEKQPEVPQVPVSYTLPLDKVIQQEPPSSLQQMYVEPQTPHDPPTDPTIITPPQPNPTIQSSNHPKPMETCQSIMVPAKILNMLLSEQHVLPPATSTIPPAVQSVAPQAQPLKGVSTTTSNQLNTPPLANQTLALEQTNKQPHKPSKPQQSNQSSAPSTKATEPPKKSFIPVPQTPLSLHKPSANYNQSTSKTAPHTNQPSTKTTQRRSPPSVTLTPNASTSSLNTPSSNQSFGTAPSNNQPTKSLQTNPPFMKATPPPRRPYIPLSQIPLPSNTPQANQSYQTAKSTGKLASHTNQSLTKAAPLSTTSVTQTSSALALNKTSANPSYQIYESTSKHAPSKAAQSLRRSSSPPTHISNVRTSYLGTPLSNQKSPTIKPEPNKPIQRKSPPPVTHTPNVQSLSSSNQRIQTAEATNKQAPSKSSPNPQPKHTHPTTTKPMKLTHTLSASNTPPNHPAPLHKSISLPHSTNLSIFHNLPFIDELPTLTPRKRSQERTKPNKLDSRRSITPDSQPTRTRTPPKETSHLTTNSKPASTSIIKTERINLFDKFAADITPPVSYPTNSPLPAVQAIPTPLPSTWHPITVSTTTATPESSITPHAPRNLHQASSHEGRFNFKPTPSENRPTLDLPNQNKPNSHLGVGPKTPPLPTPVSIPKTPPPLTLPMQTIQPLTPPTANPPTALLHTPPPQTEHTLTPPPRTPTSPNDGISDEDIFDVSESDTTSSSWAHPESPCTSMDVSPTSIALSPTAMDVSPTTPPYEHHPNHPVTPTTPCNIRHTTIDDNGEYFSYNNQVYSWPFHGELDFNEMSDDDSDDEEVGCGKYDVRVDLVRLEEDGFVPKCFATEIMGHSCCTCCHVYCCTSPWVAINGTTDDSSDET